MNDKNVSYRRKDCPKSKLRLGLLETKTKIANDQLRAKKKNIL